MARAAGPLAGLPGFTGLMSNGEQSYAELFDASKVGLADGRLQVREVTPGDPFPGRATPRRTPSSWG